MRSDPHEVKQMAPANRPNTAGSADAPMEQTAMSRLRFIHSQLCRTNDVLDKTRSCMANDPQSNSEPLSKNPSKPTLDELLSDCETAARTAFDNANSIAQSIGE